MKKRLKGVKALTKCLDKFLAKWDLTSQFGTDFAYLYYKRIVVWTLAVTQQNDIDFQNFFESLGCNVKCDVFLYSLLHEIGHSQTLDDINEEDYAYALDRKAEPLTNAEYFRLPDEIAATQWAVDFLNEHTEEVREFWEEFVPLVMKFYEINNIEVEEE